MIRRMSDKPRPYAEIGERLVVVRKALGYETGASFARHLGVKGTTYNNWETGVQRLSLDGALEIRDRHDVPLDWLYRGKSEEMLPSKILSAWASRPRVKPSK